MPKWMKTVLAGNVVLIVLVFIAVAHAQRPAEKDSEGVDYLRVNINPTNVPPMVNINPNGGIPRVDLKRIQADRTHRSKGGLGRNTRSGSVPVFRIPVTR
jgi:hypothetical protein